MLRFALLGAGRIGRMHAANLVAHSRASLTWIYDAVPAVADEVAAKHGAKRAPDIEAALAAKDVDAVLIASPTDTHVPLITAAAKAGKAILCEKPIDLDIKKVDACWAEIGRLKPIVMVGFNRRFDPSFKAVRDRAVAGEIGRLEQLIITSRDPAPPPVAYVKVSGGLFRDMTIHDFDMARFLLGDIDEVSATAGVLIDPAIGAAGDIDSAMVTLRAKSGAMAFINNARRCSYGYDQRIELFGEKGMLQAGNRRATTVSFHGKERTEAADPLLDFFIARYREAYDAEVDHFVDCVEKGGTPLVTFADGREALRIADAAFESVKTGRTVRLAG